jgi:hypothetical protein
VGEFGSFGFEEVSVYDPDTNTSTLLGTDAVRLPLRRGTNYTLHMRQKTIYCNVGSFSAFVILYAETPTDSADLHVLLAHGFDGSVVLAPPFVAEALPAAFNGSYHLDFVQGSLMLYEENVFVNRFNRYVTGLEAVEHLGGNWKGMFVSTECAEDALGFQDSYAATRPYPLTVEPYLLFNPTIALRLVGSDGGATPTIRVYYLVESRRWIFQISPLVYTSLIAGDPGDGVDPLPPVLAQRELNATIQWTFDPRLADFANPPPPPPLPPLPPPYAPIVVTV